MDKSSYKKLIPGMLLLFALAYVAVNYGELGRFAELIVHVDLIWMLLATIVQGGTYVSLSMIWHRALVASGVEYPFRKLVPLALAKLFADQALPSGGISGIAFVINAFRQHDVPVSAGMGVMLLSLLSYYLSYALVTVVSLFVLWLFHDLHSWIIVVVAIFTVVVVIVSGSIVLLRRIPGRLPRWLLRLPVIAGVVETFADVPDDVLKRPALLFEAIFWQSLIFLLDSITLWAMLRALGSPVSFPGAFACFVVASVAATISLIPLGLGSFEFTCVGLLVTTGVRVETALTATLLLRGFILWIPMIPGLLLTKRVLR